MDALRQLQRLTREKKENVEGDHLIEVMWNLVFVIYANMHTKKSNSKISKRDGETRKKFEKNQPLFVLGTRA